MSLTCNGTSPKKGLLAAWPPVAEAASAMGCGIVGIKYVAILVSGILGHYLDVSSLSVLHSKKWFTTDQKTPAKRFLGVEGMVTD